ncbi:hypothetical protein AALP_AA1G191200 [Arabis alpina]|nr:hypothetical protein AALP_AA1G191200 [Arabis alpina]
MVPPYSNQIVSHVGGSLKNHDPFVEQNQRETRPEEKTERIQIPLLVLDPVIAMEVCEKIADEEDSLDSFGNQRYLLQEEDLGEQKGNKKNQRISGDSEVKKPQGEEALTLGMQSSPIEASGVVSGQIKGLENQSLEMKSIDKLKPEGKAETLSFPQHPWQPQERKKPLEDETLASDESTQTVSPIKASRGESDQSEGSGTKLASKPIQMDSIHGEGSGKMIDEVPFQQRLWKPPEERNKSNRRRLEKLLFDGENDEEDIVKIPGRDFMAIGTIRPEIAEKVWEKAFMIGLRVKMRLDMKILEPLNLKLLRIVATMMEDRAKTVATPSEIEIEKGNVTGLNQFGQYKQMGHQRSMGSIAHCEENNGNGPLTSRPIITFHREEHTMIFCGIDNRNCTSHHRLKLPARWLTAAAITKWDEDTEGAEDGVHEIPEMVEFSLNPLVEISSPRTIQLRRVSEDVEFELQRVFVVTSCLLLELWNADAILVIHWLATLGEMKLNWKLQVLKLQDKSEKDVPRSKPSQGRWKRSQSYVPS